MERMSAFRKREEMLYDIPNIYGFTQDSGRDSLNLDFLRFPIIFLYNVTNIQDKAEIFE